MRQMLSWYVGIDWGEQSHQVCLCGDHGEVRGERAFPHSGAGLAALVGWLLERTQAPPGVIAAAIERPDGPVVATLMEAGMVVFAVNPRQSSNLRKFFSHAGHKNDERDARMLATTLQASRAGFRRLAPRPALVRRLRERTRAADRLLQEQVRQCLRIRSALVDYFPQLLEVAGGAKNLGAPFFRELWERAPTPARARKVRLSTLQKLVRRYGVSRIDAERIRALFREPALVVAPGATEAAVETIRTALVQSAVIRAELTRAEAQMTGLLDELSRTAEAGGGPEAGGPDLVSVLRSRPGAGDQALARLFAWGFEALREGNYRRLRAYCGVAPILDQSGKSERFERRRAVPSSLQHASYILARGIVRWDEKVAAYNRKLKAQGKHTARRHRSIADQQLRVLCAMARNRTFFDPNASGSTPSTAA